MARRRFTRRAGVVPRTKSTSYPVLPRNHRVEQVGIERAGGSHSAHINAIPGSEGKGRRSIFFISGRSEAARAATEMNLMKAGYDGWTALIMRPSGSSTRPAADYTAPGRAKMRLWDLRSSQM